MEACVVRRRDRIWKATEVPEDLGITDCCCLSHDVCEGLLLLAEILVGGRYLGWLRAC